MLARGRWALPMADVRRVARAQRRVVEPEVRPLPRRIPRDSCCVGNSSCRLGRGSSRAGGAVVGEEDCGPLERGSGTMAQSTICSAGVRSGVLGEHHIAAVGHRVVHGGTRFSKPVLIDATTLAELVTLIPLAPLHQPHNLAAIGTVAQRARRG